MRKPWFLPLSIYPKIGKLIDKVPYRWRSLGGGWVWYYAAGKLSCLNREKFDGWYRFTG